MIVRKRLCAGSMVCGLGLSTLHACKKYVTILFMLLMLVATWLCFFLSYLFLIIIDILLKMLLSYVLVIVITGHVVKDRAEYLDPSSSLSQQHRPLHLYQVFGQLQNLKKGSKSRHMDKTWYTQILMVILY